MTRQDAQTEMEQIRLKARRVASVQDTESPAPVDSCPALWTEAMAVLRTAVYGLGVFPMAKGQVCNPVLLLGLERVGLQALCTVAGTRSLQCCMGKEHDEKRFGSKTELWCQG